jgi:hypothetical protein
MNDTKCVGLDVHQATFSVVVLDSIGIIGNRPAPNSCATFRPSL